MTTAAVTADGRRTKAKPATMAQALGRALRDSMAEDPTVHVLGEDVGTLGGVFRITDGLAKEFGDDRCTDTPLAEAGILGAAVGMAMYGLRPVVEMQFDAFAYPAFEQLMSHVAKMRNRTGGAMPLPITVRVPYGGGIGGVEHHSDSSEAYYMATPGLHVVTPATVEDAYGLLRESIASDDPVIFLEPKRLYWSKADWSPEAPAEVEPIGRAAVRRSGRSATLITYGPSLPVCMEAAEAAVAEGWDLEVVDLRSLVPFDDETVTASVRRTGRAVVVHESPGSAGPAVRSRPGSPSGASTIWRLRCCGWPGSTSPTRRPCWSGTICREWTGCSTRWPGCSGRRTADGPGARIQAAGPR